MNRKEFLLKEIGGLSKPSKMPCRSWSTPASECNVGSKLREIAGSVCSKCYAMKGFYSYPVVQNTLKKRLEASKKKNWVAFMTELIPVVEKSGYFRWFDSGDLNSFEQLEKIIQICKNLPKISFWLPTKEYGLIRKLVEEKVKIPRNLNIRVSAPTINQTNPPKIGRFLTSTVSSDRNLVTCVANKQGGKCLDCRACWSKKVSNVCYPTH